MVSPSTRKLVHVRRWFIAMAPCLPAPTPAHTRPHPHTPPREGSAGATYCHRTCPGHSMENEPEPEAESQSPKVPKLAEFSREKRR